MDHNTQLNHCSLQPAAAYPRRPTSLQTTHEHSSRQQTLRVAGPQAPAWAEAGHHPQRQRWLHGHNPVQSEWRPVVFIWATVCAWRRSAVSAGLCCYFAAAHHPPTHSTLLSPFALAGKHSELGGWLVCAKHRHTGPWLSQV